ncbi:hypothetical protein JHD50_09830 [Sulfurimonas sp. MAG313]|nr:hypothetical protein [Sulfurimonas sp. MAG313]MDF1881598.1 hypothetical protein [Sulfurimonas sp. MAG313]
MKNLIIIILVGIIAGSTSWGVVGLVSDRYEPFDSGTGFYLGQSILSIIALWLGYKKKFKYLVIYLISAYLSMNGYSYIFDGSEQRAWAILGMITTISLIVLPFVAGILGKLVGFIRKK